MVDDPASGYERIAHHFARARDRSIGPDVVRRWSARLGRGARVLDVACGTGQPITAVLVEEGFDVRACDGSPTLVAAFHEHFPAVPVECADVETCASLESQYDGVVSWGLVFLLPPATQRRVIARLAGAVAPGGHLLFTAPRQVLTWDDALTGLTSWSLGADAYIDALTEHGLLPEGTDEDAGGNVYYFAGRPA